MTLLKYSFYGHVSQELLSKLKYEGNVQAIHF